MTILRTFTKLFSARTAEPENDYKLWLSGGGSKLKWFKWSN